MLKSACNAMKKSIMTSAILVTVGIILEIIAQFLTLESVTPALFTYGGFLFIALGLVVFLITMIVITLPQVSQRLSACEH